MPPILFLLGDEDFIERSAFGTPDLDLTIRKPDHVGLTCAGLINRLEQLVDSPAHYITTDRFSTSVHSTPANKLR